MHRDSSRPAPDAALDFDALYRDARDDVFAYVATLLRDRGAAEDVTAPGVRARLPQRRTRFDPAAAAPRAWLFGIARNAALDELRRRKRTATLAAEPADVASPRPTRRPSRRSSAPPCAPRSPRCPRATAR